jgi:hypothetical protein
VIRTLTYLQLVKRCEVLLFSVSFAWVTSSSAAKFEFQSDTFAFANDTYRHYSISPEERLIARSRKHQADYSRSCFVLSRAAIQFHRFAEFQPDAQRCDPAEYRERVREVARIPVWSRRREKIVIPGYKNLREFSQAHEKLLKDELGRWWPTYFRFGNWRIVFMFPRSGQERLAARLERMLVHRKVQALFVTRFRPINHCVVAYESRQKANGDYEFLAYDPNDSNRPVRLTFNSSDRSFYLQRTRYFPGGRVNVCEAYSGLLN